MIVNEFVAALQNKDHVALSQCFTEECRLFDYCPSLVGRESAFIYGKRAIDMYYHNAFVLGGFSIMDPRVVDDRTDRELHRRRVQPGQQPDPGTGDSAGMTARPLRQRCAWRSAAISSP